ncbi:MAG: hypothetical protein FWH29_11100 [Methanobrevibacter sp.]|nr:hypothetical protein [Methanobrevibacter sp.]
MRLKKIIIVILLLGVFAIGTLNFTDTVNAAYKPTYIEWGNEISIRLNPVDELNSAENYTGTINLGKGKKVDLRIIYIPAPPTVQPTPSRITRIYVPGVPGAYYDMTGNSNTNTDTNTVKSKVYVKVTTKNTPDVKYVHVSSSSWHGIGDSAKATKKGITINEEGTGRPYRISIIYDIPSLQINKITKKDNVYKGVVWNRGHKTAPATNLGVYVGTKRIKTVKIPKIAPDKTYTFKTTLDKKYSKMTKVFKTDINNYLIAKRDTKSFK